MKIVVNSAHPFPQTRDFKDLKELTNDALRRNCTHDDITEIRHGIPKLHFSGILLTISMKVDKILSF